MVLNSFSALKGAGRSLLTLVTVVLSSSALTAPAIANTPEANALAPSLEALRSIAQIPELPPLADASQYLPNSQEVHIVLRLKERRVYVYKGDAVEASFPVAIGKASTPTPTGTFKVFQRIENPVWQNPWTGQITQPGPNSALGVRWIGFAEMSNGIIGFHGTPTVNSIGKAASNGCVRMYNHDVVKLFNYVTMGTTVTVEN
ncbi:MAG: L,D-transpeptidase [Cyanobacteria bacterium P01_C01_bin.89]